MKFFKRRTHKQITIFIIALIIMAWACFAQCSSYKGTAAEKKAMKERVKYNKTHTNPNVR